MLKTATRRCPICGCIPTDLLATSTVARALNCSPRHVLNLLYAGSLEGVRVGKRRWRIRHESLDAYIEANGSRGEASER